jgi:hypothetical protein
VACISATTNLVEADESDTGVGLEAVSIAIGADGIRVIGYITTGQNIGVTHCSNLRGSRGGL